MQPYEHKIDLVAGLIIEDGKILLMHNIKKGLRIEPPGGKREPGETEVQALEREILEELGARCVVGEKIGTYHTHSTEGVFNVHTYVCRLLEPPRLMEPHKFETFHWYSAAELEKLKTEGALVPNIADNLPTIRKLI